MNSFSHHEESRQLVENLATLEKTMRNLEAHLHVPNRSRIGAEKRKIQNPEGVEEDQKIKKIRTGYEGYPQYPVVYVPSYQAAYQQDALYNPDPYYQPYHYQQMDPFNPNMYYDQYNCDPYHYQQIGYGVIYSASFYAEDSNPKIGAEGSVISTDNELSYHKAKVPDLINHSKEQPTIPGKEGKETEDQKTVEDRVKPRRIQTVFSADQRARLEQEYFINNRPSIEKRIRIAEELQLSYDSVKNFFQNQRSKEKKKQRGDFQI